MSALPVQVIPEVLRRVAAAEKARFLGRLRLSGSYENRITAAERILDAFFGVRVRQPLPVHDEKVFVAARGNVQFADPLAIASRSKRGLFWLPLVKRTGNTNFSSIGLDEFE